MSEKLLKVELKPTIVKDKTLKINQNNSNYIIDLGNTIGFRKDLKLFKFVGLRTGYSKQLELSLQSILIDEKEQIVDNTFSSIKTENLNISHKIKKLELVNKITVNNYKNMVLIKKSFNNLEITYEVHLKGIEILNKNINNEYIPNELNQFLIKDDRKKNLVFIIDNPVAYDKLNNKLNIVKHKLYIKDNKIIYKKFINNVENINYPIYVDISINFNLDNNGSIRNTIIASYFNTNERWEKITNGIYNSSVDFSNPNKIKIYNDNSTFTSYISRLFLNFDTNFIKDNFIIQNVSLNLYVISNPFSLSIHNGTQNNTIMGSDFESFENIPFYSNEITEDDEFQLNIGNNVIDLGNKGKSSIVANGNTKYCLRNYLNDYLKNSVSGNTDSTFEIDPLQITLTIEYLVNVTENTTISFNEIVNGSGIIKCTAADWIDARNGIGVFDIIPNQIYEKEAVGYKYTGGLYTISRSFFNFDTSTLNNYKGNISSAFLRYFSSGSTFNIYSGVTINQGTQTTSTLLTNSDYMLFNQELTTFNDTLFNANRNIEIPLSAINISGNTRLVLLSEDDIHTYNYEYHGIDFTKTQLIVNYSPYSIYGQTFKNIQPNSFFTLKAYTNYKELNTIKWFKNQDLTLLIGTGSTITLNSSLYEDVEYIYVNVYDVLDNKICNISLKIKLNIFENYPILEERFDTNKPVDIDSIYFKFHKCLSGVCYTYIRDINNIYEENILVSDYEKTGSYNLYNEYDIIDEFYSNKYEVEIAYDINLDITKKYNFLDNNVLYNGTKILLFKQTTTSENGIYEIQYDYSMKKLNIFNLLENLFRCKININSGKYIDYEFHINGYTII
jgi:hypothetical protein